MDQKSTQHWSKMDQNWARECSILGRGNVPKAFELLLFPLKMPPRGGSKNDPKMDPELTRKWTKNVPKGGPEMDQNVSNDAPGRIQECIQMAGRLAGRLTGRLTGRSIASRPTDRPAGQSTGRIGRTAGPFPVKQFRRMRQCFGNNLSDICTLYPCPVHG